MYTPDLPRTGFASIEKPIGRSCPLPDVGPVSPGNITVVSSNIVGLPSESYETRQRNIFTSVQVIWLAPETLTSGVTSYDIRVAEEPIEINDTSISNYPKIPSDEPLLLVQEYSFRNVRAGIVVLYVQVSMTKLSARCIL